MEPWVLVAVERLDALKSLLSLGFVLQREYTSLGSHFAGNEHAISPVRSVCNSYPTNYKNFVHLSQNNLLCVTIITNVAAAFYERRHYSARDATDN